MANAILTALQGLKTQNVTAASLLRTAIIVALYLVLGIVVYIYILEERKGDERWTTIDTLYFSMVTMSTVGYGDFSPSTPASRAFTVFYILLGVTHVCLERAALLCSHLLCSALTAYRRYVFGAIASAATGLMLVFESMMHRVAAVLMKLLGIKQQEQVAVDLDGDGEVDFVEPPGPVGYYAKGTVFWVIALAILQAVSVGAFLGTQPGWSWQDAAYHCLVTMTTVGYGDVTITTQGARLCAFFHILISVTWLATFVSKLQALHYNRGQQLKRAELLKKQLDVELITSLDTNGDGVNKLEFVVGMLTKLELIDWADVEPFLAQFDALDTDGSGVLTAADLAAMVAQKQAQIEAKKAKKQEAKEEKAAASPLSRRVSMSTKRNLVGEGGAGAAPEMTDVEALTAGQTHDDATIQKRSADVGSNGGGKYYDATPSPPKGNKVAPQAASEVDAMIVADCSPRASPRSINGDGKEPAS